MGVGQGGGISTEDLAGVGPGNLRGGALRRLLHARTDPVDVPPDVTIGGHLEVDDGTAVGDQGGADQVLGRKPTVVRELAKEARNFRMGDPDGRHSRDEITATRLEVVLEVHGCGSVVALLVGAHGPVEVVRRELVVILHE